MSQQMLIVEGEERIAHWVQSYFERAGFQTRVTGNSATGVGGWCMPLRLTNAGWTMG